MSGKELWTRRESLDDGHELTTDIDLTPGPVVLLGRTDLQRILREAGYEQQTVGADGVGSMSCLVCGAEDGHHVWCGACPGRGSKTDV